MSAQTGARNKFPALGIRTITVALVVPAYALFIWMGESIWVGAVIVSAIIAGHEYFNLMESGGYPTNSKFGMLWISILIASYSGTLAQIPMVVIITWGMMTLLASALFSRRTPFLTWLSTAGGTLYIGSSLALLVPIRQTDAGFWWLAFLLIGTFMSDVGAYIIGSLFGKHKLWPEISPKKSWEGLAGALVIGPLSALWLVWASHQPGLAQVLLNISELPAMQRDWTTNLIAIEPVYFVPLPIGLSVGLAMGILIAMFGQMGDLTISMWKRHVGAKDTGTIFRGHGGMLDRLDSLLFTAPLVFAFILIF